MKNIFFILSLAGALSWTAFTSCNSGNENNGSPSGETVTANAAGQSGVKDDESQKNIVGVAVSSADHTTLVTAVQAAELVDALSNAGPFTVFAPTNAAFDNLPKGTVDNLLKPENKESLQNILQYHVYVGVLKTEYLNDGQTLGEVNGDNVTIGVKDGKYSVNGANILATVPASNGVVYVIDAVLLPPEKK